MTFDVKKSLLWINQLIVDNSMINNENKLLFHLSFEALVEREWLQAGHPFADRCSKSAFAITKHRHEAPVFLLFLDCVWQVIRNCLVMNIILEIIFVNKFIKVPII